MVSLNQRCWQLGVGMVGAMLLSMGCAQTSVNEDTPGDEAQIRIGGSAETLEALETLTEAYTASGAAVTFDFLPPSQSSSGIQGIKDDVLDIGAVSIDPQSEDFDGLQYHLLTQTPLVIIVHETVTGVEELTTQQLQDIYRGDLTNWQALGGPDAEIVLLDFAEDENEKALLRQHYLGTDLQVSDQAVVFPEDDELFETALITPYSIAAIPLEDDVEEANVQILSLDGVAPTVENIQSGGYPMLLTLGIVVPETLDPEIQAFVDFMLGPEGQGALLSPDAASEDSE